jgi:hypothetical protein
MHVPMTSPARWVIIDNLLLTSQLQQLYVCVKTCMTTADNC